MSGSSSDSKPNAGLANSFSNVFKLVSAGRDRFDELRARGRKEVCAI